jgi:hypothetical protein
MKFSEIEGTFNRALGRSFSKKKWLFIFPVLVVCGILTVFCRALAVEAGDWVVLSLTFLPIFLCSSLLLATGVVLIRIYHNELKEIPVSYRKILKQSWEVIVGVSYLSLPLMLGYLTLWTVLGIFYLLREIPGVGNAMSTLLSFGPFLLVLGSLILTFVNLVILFFVSPQVALKSGVKLKFAEETYKRICENVFTNFVLLLVGMIPLIFSASLLCLAAWMTGISSSGAQAPLTVGLQWFFVMLPFCALLAPSVTFFFNFSAEAYVLMRRKAREPEKAHV